jgi:hypothetical protein
MTAFATPQSSTSTAHSESLWLDCDAVLDWLSRRQPWAASIHELVRRSATGDWCLWVSPLTLSNVHYIYRKQEGTAKALAAIRKMVHLVNIAGMDASPVQAALASGRTDFEDELQIASARSLPNLSAIITRNLADYAHSEVPAVTAQDWLLRHPLT